jgi:hypothetical protein
VSVINVLSVTLTILFFGRKGATGVIKGFSAATRAFVGRTIVSFYHFWTSTSTSESDALFLLRKEAMAYLDVQTLAAHKQSFAEDLQVTCFLFVFNPSFISLVLQAALEAGGEQEADLSDADLTALINRICDNVQDVFDYLEHNVLPMASRHFRYVLGDHVYEEMATNNLSEAQNSRFDKFVGLSTSVQSVLMLVRFCITYLRSGGNTYMTDKGEPRKTRAKNNREAATRRDTSVRMEGWSLGATFQSMRRAPKGAAAEDEIDVDLLEGLGSDESD